MSVFQPCLRTGNGWENESTVLMSPPCECKAGDKGHVTTFQTKLCVQNEEVPKPSEKQPACAGTLPRLASVHLFLTPALSLLSDHELLIWPKCRMSFVLITGGWTHSPQAWVTIQFTIYTFNTMPVRWACILGHVVPAEPH